MTIKELIIELQHVEDQDQEVQLDVDGAYYTTDSVSEDGDISGSKIYYKIK